MTNTLVRCAKHLWFDDHLVQKALPPQCVAEIDQAITAVEKLHPGEICVVVEANLPLGAVLRHVSPQQRARSVFGERGIWDTDGRNGVLLYVLLADRSIEIVADRYAQNLATAAEWQAVIATIAPALAVGRYSDGIRTGVSQIAQILARSTVENTPKVLPNVHFLRQKHPQS